MRGYDTMVEYRKKEGAPIQRAFQQTQAEGWDSYIEKVQLGYLYVALYDNTINPRECACLHQVFRYYH